MERRRVIETWPAEAAPSGSKDDDRVLFDAEIRPHRSLPHPAFYFLMAGLTVISFAAGIAFVSMGAWPVLGYFGLDVLLIWICFRLSYRDGRRREIVQVTPDEIRVARSWPAGRVTRYRLPAAWTRVELAGEGEPDVQARLTAMGKSLVIGAMLSPRERESLAEAMRDALAKARRARGPAPAQESGGAA
ncbi:DUF2244 domain-containing protein [Marinicauda salina]|uniref:DUF2244 domain-containing protein n=1 Tax=Marinicauda salina TaxID=2135793 RepID=A0A2U2BWI2_9PROT|nr:DUF2244 domain-containing protein [Marinicauda salina]PWE18378.1 DUF2244 domain-containing protein [Marinicauda salina]